MRVLKTWATSGPLGSSFSSTSLPLSSSATRVIRVRRQSAQRQRVEQLGEPGLRFARDAEDRDEVPLGDRFDDVALQLVVGRRRARRSSASSFLHRPR